MRTEDVRQRFDVVSRLQAGYYFDPPDWPGTTDYGDLRSARSGVGGRGKLSAHRAAVLAYVQGHQHSTFASVRAQMPTCDRTVLQDLLALCRAGRLMRQRDETGLFRYVAA